MLVMVASRSGLNLAVRPRADLESGLGSPLASSNPASSSYVHLLLCQLRSERHWAGCEVCVREEGSVNGVGEAAFEDAKRLGFVLAAFAAALKELTCGLMVVGLGDRDPVDRGVELR